MFCASTLHDECHTCAFARTQAIIIKIVNIVYVICFFIISHLQNNIIFEKCQRANRTIWICFDQHPFARICTADIFAENFVLASYRRNWVNIITPVFITLNNPINNLYYWINRNCKINFCNLIIIFVFNHAARINSNNITF